MPLVMKEDKLMCLWVRFEFELMRRVRGWITARRFVLAMVILAHGARFSRHQCRDSPDATGSRPRDRVDSPSFMGLPRVRIGK